MAEKRRMGIEAALSWAYRDELPKEGARSRLAPAAFWRAWGGVERFGELLAEIDDGENIWGLAPDLTAASGPNPDAVRIALAVEGLDERGIGIPEGWQPLEDMLGLGFDGHVDAARDRAMSEILATDAEGFSSLRKPPRFLVVRHALLRSAPPWEGDAPVLQVESANGKPRWFRRIETVTEDGERFVHEVDGYDRRGQRPYPGAYRRFFLDPDPAAVAVARADFEVWWVALGILHDELCGSLESIDLQPCALPARPWMEEAARARQVLPNLLPVHNPDMRDVSVASYYAKRPARALTCGSRLT